MTQPETNPDVNVKFTAEERRVLTGVTIDPKKVYPIIVATFHDEYVGTEPYWTFVIQVGEIWVNLNRRTADPIYDLDKNEYSYLAAKSKLELKALEKKRIEI